AKRGDAELAFQLAAYYRSRKNPAAAFKVLQTIKAGRKDLANPDAWWTLRHALGRDALKAGRIKLAFEMTREARPSDVNLAKDQAFFAGWLALKKLNKPVVAANHFKRMLALADGPLSRSKAGYWLGVALKASGKKTEALAQFKSASEVLDTFHGLLARQQLGGPYRLLVLPAPRLPNETEVRKFLNSELSRAAVLVSKLGLKRSYPLDFHRQLADTMKSEGDFVLLAQLARNLGDGQLEVRAGKTGVARGFNLYMFSYPIDRLPAYKPLRPPLEPAFLLSIGRQESEFNTAIVSRAGARGLLQVMPITARHVCRDYKLKCRIGALLSDTAYNVTLASAYIADRQDDVGGSYILTLTSYNAGPGRTRQWLRQLGDPRKSGVDPLEWIYRIPFDETRNYVQKVLANIQIYRARLGEAKPVRLGHDMRRAQAD
ncbi:MAG TPA: lytic transglycosylase domain-containing protein, partial [Hyphomicrobiaceae bacterium]|nr:lytic transglycosylase domain-containing protein [Hyphomicrobiaceae bacterium]